MRQPLLPSRHNRKAIIGMVHLLPLPGSHRWQGSFQQVLDAALRDAENLAKGGVDAVIVENYGDTPFFPESVPPATTAAIAVIVAEVMHGTALPVGVNVLRNDAAAALGICAATGASLLRVNVHTGAMLTDQGWISGRAHETLRARHDLGVDVAIMADVFVKHATPAAGLSIEDAARDTWERGHADALIVSGAGTGQPASLSDIGRVRSVVPGASLFIGSGLTVDNATHMLQHADGAIVGSALKQDGLASSPVSLERVQRLMETIARI